MAGGEVQVQFGHAAPRTVGFLGEPERPGRLAQQRQGL